MNILFESIIETKDEEKGYSFIRNFYTCKNIYIDLNGEILLDGKTSIRIGNNIDLYINESQNKLFAEIKPFKEMTEFAYIKLLSMVEKAISQNKTIKIRLEKYVVVSNDFIILNKITSKSHGIVKFEIL